MFRTILTPASRTVLAPTASRCLAASYRMSAFHTTPIAARTVTETVKDAADTVNKKVGQALASGIEKGQKATEATKETFGAMNAKGEKAAGKAQEAVGSATAKSKETANVAGQKANQAAAGAREGARDFKSDVEKETRK